MLNTDETLEVHKLHVDALVLINACGDVQRTHSR